MSGSRWVTAKKAATHLGVSEGMLEEDRRTGRKRCSEALMIPGAFASVAV